MSGVHDGTMTGRERGETTPKYVPRSGPTSAARSNGYRPLLLSRCAHHSRVAIRRLPARASLIAFWPTPIDAGAGPFIRAITRLVPLLTNSRIEFGANILLFVPLGLLLALILRQWSLVLPVAIVCTLFLESVQGFFLDRRTPSKLDMVANTAGACIGLLAVAFAHGSLALLVPKKAGPMTYLPSDEYARIERSMPIACVDFIPVRISVDGGVEVGLILRDSPFGRVWCHLGGRIQRGETIREALQRHSEDTLGVSLRLEDDPQPRRVHQWFPNDLRPELVIAHGNDPRKHAIGLSFVAELDGDATPRNEALDFCFVEVDRLPEPMWPGSAQLIELLQPQAS